MNGDSVGTLRWENRGVHYWATLSRQGAWTSSHALVAEALNRRFSFAAIPPEPSLGSAGYYQLTQAEEYLRQFGPVQAERAPAPPSQPGRIY